MQMLLIILVLCIGGFVYNNPEIWSPFSFFSASEPTTTQQSVSVEMYSLTTCGICKIMARQMDQAGIRYTRYEIDTDYSRKVELAKRLQQAHIPLNRVTSAPVLFAGTHVFWGMTPISNIQAAIK